MMHELSLKGILEALLMTADKPLSLEALSAAFEEGNAPAPAELLEALESLAKDCEGRAVELKRLASGYCYQTRSCYSPWIARFSAEKPQKYSRALLETLAIIAWRQPVTRADIEAIRGVSSAGNHFKTLLEREWIRIAGHRDVPGKPAVYVTTRAFLDYFNLESLKALPALTALPQQEAAE
ncbi:SMC-Scp complex subunit ScpB [Legionella geestiana]|nr:SMC-Scp complex subunit ScpB [Legionella geestiana]QBS11254.1 SMC-Scp complex subunit ScpB [Legionella geestiana]QDQ40949.1 SMC-Scp complex subunit ScpB [Legionella geestiana]